MTDALLELTSQAIASSWVYAALFALAALDGFFPVVPGETAVVTVSVFAASGEPNVVLVIAVAALGVFAGDHTSYLIGRASIGRLNKRAHAGTRGRAAFDWAERTLAERGGMVLVASRYVPGVRTATTMTLGAVGYPLPYFSLIDSVAASFWATGWALIGYVGGVSFRDQPVKGLLLGIGIAVAVTALVESSRYLRRRFPRGVPPAARPGRGAGTGTPPRTGDESARYPDRG